MENENYISDEAIRRAMIGLKKTSYAALVFSLAILNYNPTNEVEFCLAVSTVISVVSIVLSNMAIAYLDEINEY